MSRLPLLSLLLLAACHRAVAGEVVDSLVGLTVPLTSSPALRLVLPATVDGAPAELALDPSQPVSFVSEACVPGPDVIARVKVPDAFGPDETFPLARVKGLVVAGRRFRPFDAALAAGRSCIVVLGAAELADVAIEVNPALRTARFRPTQPRAAWVAEAEAGGDDAQVLTVTKEPRTDWPLLIVRLRQGEAVLDATMLLSLREARSALYEAAGRSAGLRPGLELLKGLPLPDGVQLPPELSQLKGFAFDSLELATGFGLKEGSLELEKGAPPHAVQGLVGADVWGRFVTTYDVREGVLVLRRPRVFTSGSRAKCERDGVTSGEACFEFHTELSPGELAVIATVWSPLPEGAHVSFALTGGNGGCRVGVTFAPGDRGRSTQHRFPWPKLRETLPGCVAAFEGVTAVEPDVLEEGAMAECPGVCGWALDAETRRLSCECQPGVRTAGGEAEKKLLELFRRALETLQAPGEQEPADPE